MRVFRTSTIVSISISAFSVINMSIGYLLSLPTGLLIFSLYLLFKVLYTLIITLLYIKSIHFA